MPCAEKYIDLSRERHLDVFRMLVSFQIKWFLNRILLTAIKTYLDKARVSHHSGRMFLPPTHPPTQTNNVSLSLFAPFSLRAAIMIPLHRGRLFFWGGVLEGFVQRNGNCCTQKPF